MNFGDAIASGLAKYVVWRGRASRSEFWFFVLFNFLANIGAIIIDAGAGSTGLVYALVILGLFLPGLSVFVRRLHDTDRSGWWYWLALIPLVGAIILLIWLCQRGTLGENTYGPDPLDGVTDDPHGASRSNLGDLDRLERLAELRAKGALTDAEYDAQKGSILR